MVDVLLCLKSVNLVHYDIKVDNILVSSISTTLIDFGSSVFADKESRIKSYTPSYTAPEILTESEVLDLHKIDIWGLGISMLELVLGKKIIRSTKDIPAFREIIALLEVNEKTMNRIRFPEITITKPNCVPWFYGAMESNLQKNKKP